MKLLVTVKRVIDHNITIRVKMDESGVETANLRMSLNPFCLHAVEEAVRMKEQGIAREVISDVCNIISADTFVRPLYAGNALATVQSKEPTKVLTIRTTVFPPATPWVIILPC